MYSIGFGYGLAYAVGAQVLVNCHVCFLAFPDVA